MGSRLRIHLYGRDNDMEYEEKFNRLKAVADSFLYENATNATEKIQRLKKYRTIAQFFR